MRNIFPDIQPAKYSFRWLLVSTFLPTVLIIIYFFGFATDRYQSEATFVVRNPGAGTLAEIANIVQGTKVLTNPEDAYIIHEYLRSRDAMRALQKDHDLLHLFEGYGDDFLWTYPPLLRKPNEERLYQHYLRFVDVSFDKSTGISTLRAQAFDPRDAQRIVTALLLDAERLINRLNERAQRDVLRTAEQEVLRARANAVEGQRLVTAFRAKESMIDPSRFSSAVVLETVSRLSFELAMVNAQLSQLLKSAPQNVQVEVLKLRAVALREQIAAERQQIGGSPSGFAPLIDEYEKLTLHREFSERLLQSALTSLDLARVEASRQRLFLETISAPTVSDYPAAPFRWIWCLTSISLSILVFWFLRTIMIDILSHAGQ